MQAFFLGANLPFFVALLAGLALALTQIVAGGDASDAEADTDADADPGGDVIGGLLEFVGFGRLPVLLVIMSLLISFAVVGLLANAIVRSLVGTTPDWLLAFSLPLAVLAGAPISGALVGLLARITPRSTTAVGYEELIGCVGRVASATISTTYGRVRVTDRRGGHHTVYAVVEDATPIAEDTEVALVRYDPAQQRYIVRALA
jgi:membrane protein implicated in regulation of membrane protease activity